MLTEHLSSLFRRLRRSTAARVDRKPMLQLEPLEDRATPSVSPNDLFVASLYQGLLGRPADTNGLAYWSGQLNAGTSREQVAQGIATSQEAFTHDVILFYESFLNRPVDNGGLTYWMGKLQSGWTLDNVKAGILGSGEFLNVAGGTTSDFLQGLYQYELGGNLDAAGFTYWNNLMSEGLSRTGVAVEILATPAASQMKTTSFYIDTLARMPDAAGLNYWSGQLQANVPESRVLAGILGSPEYFTRVQQAAQTSLTDSNAAATQMIDHAGLFTGPQPNAEYLALNFQYVPVKQVDFSYLVTTTADNSVDNNTVTTSGGTTTCPPVVSSNPPANTTNCPPFVAPCDSNDGTTDDSSTDTSACDYSDPGSYGDDSGSDSTDDSGASDDVSFDDGSGD